MFKFKNCIKLFFLGSFLFSSFFLLNNYIFAGDTLENAYDEANDHVVKDVVNKNKEEGGNILKGSDALLVKIAQFMLRLTIVLGVPMLIGTGIYFFFSLGDQSKVKSATKAMSYIILGMVLALSSVAIIYLIHSIAAQNSFGI